VAIRLNKPTRWSLWLVSAGALAMAIATGSGACVNQPQTIPGEGGGGQGGGSSGSGSTVDPEKARELFSALEQDLLKACGACHDIGGTANTPFLKGPDRYATIVSWPGIVVKNAAESKLLTYPITGGQHLGVNIDSGDNKTTLLPKVKAWLEEEAKGIVLNQEASAGPLIEPFSPILGFNAIYLSPLGKDFEGMAVTFSANALDATTLELDDIEVHPTAKFGVQLVHPLFTVYPKGREPESDPVDSFSNVDQVFEAGQTGALGPGTVILTNWSTDLSATQVRENRGWRPSLMTTFYLQTTPLNCCPSLQSRLCNQGSHFH